MFVRLHPQRHRDSLGFCVPEFVPKQSYAVRRRFSGPLLLPPLSRRHSILDTKKLLDLEALYKSALANLEAPDLEDVNRGSRSVIVHSSRHSFIWFQLRMEVNTECCHGMVWEVYTVIFCPEAYFTIEVYFWLYRSLQHT